MSTLTPTQTLRQCGQSLWLDVIERRILADDTLPRLIQEDGIAGMISNPEIFETAIIRKNDYRAAIAAMANRGAAPEEIYERLVIHDVRKAADLFREVFHRSDETDGYVSLDVSPLLADDTDAMVAEAKRLWRLVGRRNVMIKVPATRAGLPAVKQLIRSGINVNVTLLFSIERYLEVTNAYMTGLEQRLRAGRPIDRVLSVASFSLGRIDTKVDALLDDIANNGNGWESEIAHELRGQAATALAGMAYRRFQQQFTTARWRALATCGAHKQRLLWANSSTTDALYRDIKYVEGLIGPETITTVPLETIEAYRAHGRPASHLVEMAARSLGVIEQLKELGIDLRHVEEALETEAVRNLVDPHQKMLATLTNMTEGSYASIV